MPGVLEDKVAIVTGSGRGIGRGIAILMAQEGAKVVVVDPGAELDGSGGSIAIADSVVNEIRAHGGEAAACYESVATMKGGEAIVQTALDSFGKLDVVVTCAGILRDRMLFNMTEEEWDSVIEVHLKGTFTVVKHACILFRQQRSGSIITFSSESGLIGNSGQANYGAAKSGIAGFTKVVARDMGRYGVTANSIAPRANTRMTSDIPSAASQIRAAQGVAAIEGEDDLESAKPRRRGPLHRISRQRLRRPRQRTDLPGLRRHCVADVPATAGTLYLQRRGAMVFGPARPPCQQLPDQGHRQPGAGPLAHPDNLMIRAYS